MIIKINCTIGNNDLYLYQYIILYYIHVNRQIGSDFWSINRILVMKERILAVMEHEGLTPSKFAEAIGIQRSAMSHIISGRNNPSLDVLIKILERFTYVDSDWLLFGKGTMMREHVLTETTSMMDKLYQYHSQLNTGIFHFEPDIFVHNFNMFCGPSEKEYPRLINEKKRTGSCSTEYGTKVKL